MKAIPRPKRRPAPPPESQIVVRGDHITLGQLLKAADIIGTGGEAKFYLADTVVYVNEEPEQRRGRKLRPGDLIVFPDAPPVRLVAPPSDVVPSHASAPETEGGASRAKNKPGGDVRAEASPPPETHGGAAREHSLQHPLEHSQEHSLEHRQEHHQGYPQSSIQENPR